jgi:hypothetical protein
MAAVKPQIHVHFSLASLKDVHNYIQNHARMLHGQMKPKIYQRFSLGSLDLYSDHTQILHGRGEACV